MTVNELIKKLDELKGRDLDNGDLPIVLGLTGDTMPDEVFVEHFDSDRRLPYVRICSVKDERLGPAAFGRFS
jgi:hypothetical protein